MRTFLVKSITAFAAALLTASAQAADTAKPTATTVSSRLANPLAAMENAEMKRVIEEAVSELPENFRVVFMLREVEGLSIEETADMLGIPSATVRTRDHRARILLRQKLGERIDRTIPSTFEFLSTRCDRLVMRVMNRLSQ